MKAKKIDPSLAISKSSANTTEKKFSANEHQIRKRGATYLPGFLTKIGAAVTITS